MAGGHWRDRLLGSTRGRVLALLRRSEHTVADLAAEVGLTDNAVRLHLAALERDGLVEPCGRRQEWTGKPAVVYRSTTDAEALFPKAYAAVLGALLDEVAAAHGPAHTEALLERAGTRLGAAAAGHAPALEARVRHAAAVLTSLGGLVEIVEEADGWRIEGYSCPLGELLPEHPGACRLAETLVAAVAGAEVTECCERGERPRCVFRVVAA